MTKPRNELVLSGSRHVASWLSQYKVSLGFTTYQAGKLFLVGLQPDGRLSIFERTFNRCMGLCVSPDAQTLWMTSLYQLWRFENYLPPGVTTQDGYDRLYVPVTGHTTGDIDLHDIHLDASGNPNFCVTLFNCLGAVSQTHSFRPTWRPPFISGLVPEDRCHLNGLAVDPTTQEPAYVTMVGQSDVSDGWRDKRENGGLLMDVASEEIVGEGLSMPHSPRVHPDYPGRVWLLNAGTGYFGYIDTTSTDRSFVEIAFCPGFTRGLSFVGRYALVGMSAARENRTFQGLPLDANLSAKGAEPRCAIHVINLDTGATEHWIRIEGVVRELYDVVALHGVARPQMLGFKTDEIRRALRLETDGPG